MLMDIIVSPLTHMLHLSCPVTAKTLVTACWLLHMNSLAELKLSFESSSYLTKVEALISVLKNDHVYADH